MDKEILELKKKLYLKLSGIENKLNKWEKDGNNPFSKYNYVSSNQCFKQVKEACQEFKIFIMPCSVDFEENEYNTKNKKGEDTLTIRTKLTRSYEIVDLDTGYSEQFQDFGAEQDTGGKSLAQAQTQGDKYFYFKVFKMYTEEKEGDSKTTEIAASSSMKKTTTKKIEFKSSVNVQFNLHKDNQYPYLSDKAKIINLRAMIKSGAQEHLDTAIEIIKTHRFSNANYNNIVGALNETYPKV